MSANKIPDRFKGKKPPKIVVKTAAKSIQGRLQAIIAQHLICNWPEDGDIVLLQNEAAKCILAEFDVREKVGV